MKRKKAVGTAFLTGIVFLFSLTGCGKKEQIDQGMQAIEAMDYQGALTYFEQAQAEEENPKLIARGQGIAYMGMADYNQAILCFEQALSYSNGLIEAVDYDLNYYLATAFTKNNQLAEAEEIYNAILALKSSEKDAYFLRGNIRLGLGKIEEAQADFDKVVALDSSNYDRLIQIYEILNQYGYAEIGKAYLDAVIEKQDNKMSAYDKGRIYYYTGEYQKAYQVLEEAKEKGDAKAYLYLGKSYEATGDYNYASSVYRSYLEKDTSNAEIYNQLGLCEITKGEYESALNAFQTAMSIENNGMMQTLAFNEIVAYEYLGEYQKARELIEGYLQTYPDDETARREYIFLSTR